MFSGIATVSLTMKKFSYNIKKQSILNATYAIRNCIQGQVCRYIACKCTRRLSTKYRTHFQIGRILKLKYSAWTAFRPRICENMNDRRLAHVPILMTRSRMPNVAEMMVRILHIRGIRTEFTNRLVLLLSLNVKQVPWPAYHPA